MFIKLMYGEQLTVKLPAQGGDAGDIRVECYAMTAAAARTSQDDMGVMSIAAPEGCRAVPEVRADGEVIIRFRRASGGEG